MGTSGVEGFDGERLRAARKAAGMTQKELAEQVGVSAMAVSEWERGKRSPWGRNFAALLTALDLTAGDLALPLARPTLAQLRQRCGYNVADLAERLGVSYSAVAMTETGRLYPGDPEAYAVALGISVDEMWDAWEQSRPGRPSTE